MTRQELLTKLATECKTWDDAIHLAVDIEMKLGHTIGPLISKDDWLAERERLLNKPSWKDAPEGATHLAIDADRHWAWVIAFENDSICRSVPDGFLDVVSSSESGGYLLNAGKSIAIPAGYDWRDSLEERPA